MKGEGSVKDRYSLMPINEVLIGDIPFNGPIAYVPARCYVKKEIRDFSEDANPRYEYEVSFSYSSSQLKKVGEEVTVSAIYDTFEEAKDAALTTNMDIISSLESILKGDQLEKIQSIQTHYLLQGEKLEGIVCNYNTNNHSM